MFLVAPRNPREEIMFWRQGLGRRLKDRLTESSVQKRSGSSLPRLSNTLRFGSFSSSLLHEQERSPSS